MLVLRIISTKSLSFLIFWTFLSPLLIFLLLELGWIQKWLDIMAIPGEALTDEQRFFPYVMFLGYWFLLGLLQNGLIVWFVKRNVGYLWGFGTAIVGLLVTSLHELIVFERMGIYLSNNLEGVLLLFTFPIMLVFCNLIVGSVQSVPLARLTKNNANAKTQRNIRIFWSVTSLCAGILSVLFGAIAIDEFYNSQSLAFGLLLGAFVGSLIKGICLSCLLFQDV